MSEFDLIKFLEQQETCPDERPFEEKQRALLEYRQIQEEELSSFHPPSMPSIIHSAQERTLANEARQHLQYCIRLLNKHARELAYTQLAKQALLEQSEKLSSMIAEFDLGKHQHQVKYDVLAFLEQLPEMLVSSRLRLGLSQKKLANRAGLSRVRMNVHEKTQFAGATLRQLLNIATALEQEEEDSI